MNWYLDTSTLLPLFVPDVFSARIQAALSSAGQPLWLSDFARAEFAAVVALRTRTQTLSPTDAAGVFADLDIGAGQATAPVETGSVDILLAETHLRRLDLTLRAADAVHLALVARLGATLATFDVRMADCARKLGLSVAAI